MSMSTFTSVESLRNEQHPLTDRADSSINGRPLNDGCSGAATGEVFINNQEGGDLT